MTRRPRHIDGNPFNNRPENLCLSDSGADEPPAPKPISLADIKAARKAADNQKWVDLITATLGALTRKDYETASDALAKARRIADGMKS